MAQYRQLVSAGGISEDNEGGYWDGFWQACKDPFTWLFAAMHFCLIIAQSFKDFFPSVSLSHLGPENNLTDVKIADCRHSWVQQDHYLLHSSTSICRGLHRHPGCILVVGPLS